jgi:DNA-binding response OmpR family regulator
VVDDDPLLLSMLTDFLTAEGRYSIEVAQDGYDGLIKVGSFRPDVLILDIRMPGIDGVEVCRRVKADPGSRATKILILTGYTQGDTRARVMEAGADMLLEKPIPLTRLQADVDGLLGISSNGHHTTGRAVAPTA